MGSYLAALTLVAFDEAAGETGQQDDSILYLTAGVARYAVLGKTADEAGDDRALALVVGVRGDVDVTLRYGFDGAAFQLAPESAVAYERLKARDGG